MTEAELYKELGLLNRDKDRWKEAIPYVSYLLSHDSVKIQAKALWLLGEMGLVYPQPAQDAVPTIASFLDSPEPLLRERAINALGRIGRGRYQVIEPYWTGLFRFASDEEPKVRLAFIWSSENIAVNTPDIYENYMPVFAKLLYDADAFRSLNGKVETLCSFDTLQVRDYSKFNMAGFNAEHKKAHHEKQFPLDLKKAYEMGARLSQGK